MFYVTAKNETKLYFMLGPFKSHEQALDMVDRAMTYAAEVDPRSWWMEWGTSGSDDVKFCPLNDALKIKA